jgi:hypothetical protein
MAWDIEDLYEGSVVAEDWGQPTQRLWTLTSADNWESDQSYRSSDEMHEVGDLTLLGPVDRDAYEAGRREGRFEVLRDIDGALRRIGNDTYKIPRLTD